MNVYMLSLIGFFIYIYIYIYKGIIEYVKLVESPFKIFIYLIQYVIKKEEVLLNT